MDQRIANNIYAVKGLCALLIVIYHYSVWYNDYIHEISFKYFNFAYLTFAVPLFFVFSAFFLYKKAIQLKNPVRLVLHRMTRLYPMYWIAVLFSSVVILLNQEALGAKQILLNLTMVEKVFGVNHIDGAYWTMFYELMLLLIFAVASLLTIRKEKLICRTFELCVGWLSIGALSALFMKFAGISSSTVAVILFACRYTPVFVFGIVLSNRYLLENRTLTNRQFYGLGIACILYEILLAVDVYQSMYGIAAIVIAYLVISGAFVNSRMMSNKILIFLGKISYNIYLIHNQFGRIVISRCGGGGSRLYAYYLWLQLVL